MKTATSAALSEGCGYTYDAYGNRTSQAPYGGTNYACLSNAENFTGNNNRIDGASYDASGDLLEDPSSMAIRHSYTYDGEGRLASVDGTTSYVYGADGMRVGKQTGSDTTNYIYDYDGSLIARYLNGSSAGQTQEIWVGGKRWGTLWQGSSTSGFFFTLSALNWVGTDEVQSDPSGDVTASFSYLPFGDGLTTAIGDPNEAHYTGKDRDSESGNDYFGARYYASAMGRFLSPDWSSSPEAVPYASLANPQSLNLYTYAGNNPLSRIDADGHSWFQDFLNGVASATVRPLATAVQHPVITAEAIGNAVAHPIATAQALRSGVVTTSQQVMTGNGTAIGTAVGTVGMALIPGVGEAGEAAEGAADVASE